MEQKLPIKVDNLLRNLQSVDADIRKTAAEEIGKLRPPKDRRILRHVLHALKSVAVSDENEYIRSAATQSYLALGGQDKQLNQEVETKSTQPLQNKCMLCSINSWDKKKDLSFSSSKRVGYKTHQLTTYTLPNILLCNGCSRKIIVAKILKASSGYLGLTLGFAIKDLLEYFLNINISNLLFLGIIGCSWLLGMFLSDIYKGELNHYRIKIQAKM